MAALVKLTGALLVLAAQLSACGPMEESAPDEEATDTSEIRASKL